MARKTYRIRERKYPLPKPDEWDRTPSYTNDNPWDWLRLDAVYAYPPKIVQRAVRKPKGKPVPEVPELTECVEIRCFPKRGPRFSAFPCRCTQISDGEILPDFPLNPILHDASDIRIRHRRIQNLPTWLVIERRRFKCQRCNATFSEEFHDIYTDKRVTEQLRTDIIMTAIKRPFSDAAVLMSVDDMYVKRTFQTYAATRLKDYRFKLPKIMGVDEVTIFDPKKANFVVTDLYKRQILDFGEGRTSADLEKIFGNHNDIKERHNVRVFVQDMNDDYRKFSKANFRDAKIVIDKFHVLMTINKCMNSARIAFGKGPGMTDEDRQRLGRQRFLFLEASEKMTEAEAKARDAILKGSPVLSAAYEIKRRFYGVYQQKTRLGAEARYAEWVEKVFREESVHFLPAVNTINNWHYEIFNYFDFRNRYNNGFVEALNGRLRRLHEAGPLIDFKTFRAKALLRYGAFHGRDQISAYSLHGLRQNRWPRFLDEGDNISSGFDPDALFSDLERGLF